MLAGDGGAMDDSGSAKSPKKPLREALRSARIEAAERSAVVVELRDAEAARLEMLNDALESLFADIPPEHLEQFDRGIAGGSQPRLWIDMVAHVSMGRDKRTYRFMQDTVHGRRVLAESLEVQPIVEAVTRYVARRLVAREYLLAGTAIERLARATVTWNAIRMALARMSREPWVAMLAGLALGALFMFAILMRR
jgi:hypothetical protein